MMKVIMMKLCTLTLTLDVSIWLRKMPGLGMGFGHTTFLLTFEGLGERCILMICNMVTLRQDGKSVYIWPGWSNNSTAIAVIPASNKSKETFLAVAIIKKLYLCLFGALWRYLPFVWIQEEDATLNRMLPMRMTDFRFVIIWKFYKCE